MNIHCKYDALVKVTDLKPHPKNRNQHSFEQIDRLAQILDYQGIRAPIVISKLSGYIVKGHGTLKSIEKNKWTEAPVVYQGFESQEQEYLFLQSDNAIASWAELDLSGIHLDIGDLGPFDLDLLGIKDFQLEPEPNENDTDETPEVPKEAKTKRGELWILGNHRLLIDDCTVKDNAERMMGGEKADMVYTDPPYGICLDGSYSSMPSRWNNESYKHKFKDIEGDNVDYDPSPIFQFKPKEMFIWGANNFISRVPGAEKGSWMVWDKKVEANLDKMISGDFELCWSKNRHKYAIGRFKFSGIFGTEKEDTKARVHPSQKPVALHEWFFDRWGKDLISVVDLYLGSGSTLIACEKTNRKCYGMEIEPLYGDVIIQRWEKYTGKQAVREDGKKFSELNG